MPKVVDAEARRIELAGAAARVIARAGIAGASMRDIATEAGWTTGTLTHYFGDKREMLRFTLLASLKGRMATVDIDPDTPAPELIRQTLCVALPVDEASLLHWRLTLAFYAYSGSGHHEFVELQRNATRRFRDRLTWLLLAAKPQDHDSARTEAELLIATVNGIAVVALFDPESWPPERQYEALDLALDR